MSDSDLIPFPVSKIKPIQDDLCLGGNACFNPSARVKVPPHLEYSMAIQLEEIDLGDESPFDDEYLDSKLDLYLELSTIGIDCRRWQDLDQTQGKVSDERGSSVCIADEHWPIFVNAMHFRRLQGVHFNVKLDLTIPFDVYFEPARFVLDIDIRFRGHVLVARDWLPITDEPFPESWRVPEELNEQSALEMFERFVDTSDYSLVKGDGVYRLEPIL